MKLLFVPILFASVLMPAQSKKKIPSLKIDTLSSRTGLNTYSTTSKKEKQKDLYKILVVKPKNPEIYACLKNNKKDTTEYKILNSAYLEKLKFLSKTK